MLSFCVAGGVYFLKLIVLLRTIRVIINLFFLGLVHHVLIHLHFIIYFDFDTIGILGEKLTEQSRHLAIGIGLLGKCVGLINVLRGPLLVESSDGCRSLLFDVRFLGTFAARKRRVRRITCDE